MPERPTSRAALARLAVLTTASSALVACGGAFHARQDRSEEWYALSTPHVHLETDVGSREAREMAWMLEDLHGGLAEVFFGCRAEALEDPVEVTLFAHADDYRAVAPPGTSGFVEPAASDLVVLDPRVVLSSEPAERRASLRTFTHELTHRFAADCFPDAPTWLTEGLARTFETLRVEGGSVMVGAPPFRFDAASGVVDGLGELRVAVDALPSIADLFALPREALYDLETDRPRVLANQSASWALVHMMLLGPDAELHARFTRYLAALTDGSTDAAVATHAAFDELSLDARLSAYVREAPAGSSVPHGALALGEPITRRLEAAEVNLRWAELLTHTGLPREARAHILRAEPNAAFEVRSLLLLARISGGIERHDLIARAEAIAPASRLVLGARAWVAIEAGSTAAERTAVVRELLALEAPTAVELARLADLARLNGDDQQAVALSRRAVALAPGSWEANAALALSFASAHRFEESRSRLRRALHLTGHDLPVVAAQLERLIASVDQLAPRPPGDRPPADRGDPPSTALDVARDPMAEAHGTTQATFDARRFGGRCVGFVGATPAIVLDVPTDAPALTFYAHASGESAEIRDIVLVVESSTGAVRCDDDSGGWPDPGMFVQLPPGRTRVWVGAYEQERAGTPFVLTVTHHRTLDSQPLPSVCGLSSGDAPAHGPVVVGARVVLGRHTAVSEQDDAPRAVEGSTNWVPEMEAFVGREAVVTELEGRDGAGCPVVRVDADAGSWLWRVRDMSRPGS